MKLRQNDLVWKEIDGETVLLDLIASSYLRTNKTGTYLLQLLTEDRDREALVSALVERFGISDDVAEADTASFLAQLENQGLLRTTDPVSKT